MTAPEESSSPRNASWHIVDFRASTHRAQIIDLWKSVFGYDSPHNDPSLAIRKKEEVNDGLFFVGETKTGEVLGTIVAGYDGHRGWLYSLAVRSDCRRRGLGTALVRHAENALAERGCVKINLQVLPGNPEVEAFYHRLGFSTEERISLGKRLLGEE